MLDRSKGRRLRFAVAGKIDRQSVPAVIGEKAALQRPYAMVMRGTVDECDRRLTGIKLAIRGVGVRLPVVDREVHGNVVNGVAAGSEGYTLMPTARNRIALQRARLQTDAPKIVRRTVINCHGRNGSCFRSVVQS